METEKNKGVGLPVNNSTGPLPTWLQLVWEHVSSLKFGTVQITVHDSRVVQVERAEKLRLDKPDPKNG